MRRIVMVGAVLICAVLFASNLPGHERGGAVQAAVTRTPTEVTVTNFPAVQGVSGAVNVGNLPAVQTVAGSVAVSNLPLDADGNVRMAGTVRSGDWTFIKFVDGVTYTEAHQRIGMISTAG
jgi:hypothetical protein